MVAQFVVEVLPKYSVLFMNRSLSINMNLKHPVVSGINLNILKPKRAVFIWRLNYVKRVCKNIPSMSSHLWTSMTVMTVQTTVIATESEATSTLRYPKRVMNVLYIVYLYLSNYDAKLICQLFFSSVTSNVFCLLTKGY